MGDSENKDIEFDENDLDLLGYIEEDFDINLEQLAEKLGLSKSAVHYRINKYREKGIIEGVTTRLDPLAFELNMMMITDVYVTHETGYAENIGTTIAELPGVEQVYYTMGDVDFVVVSRVQNRDQMNDLLDEIVSIDGVNETSSKFVMSEIKTGRKHLGNMSDVMQQNLLDDSE
jgi:DNA-binding Lrp family transcriptional regulator